MKQIKRLSAIILSVVFLSSFFSIPVHAVDPISAIGLASAIDAYGMAYGVGSTYDVANTQGISDNFYNLWIEFSDYQNTNNASLPTIDGQSYSYEQYITEWQDNYKAVKAEEVSHSSGKFSAFVIDEESAAVFDQFWNWLLSGPAEMVKVDNSFQWNLDNNDDIISPVVFASAPGALFVLPNPGISPDWCNPAYYPEALFHGVYTTSTKELVFPFIYKDTGYGIYRLCYISLESGFKIASQGSLNSSISIGTQNNSGVSNGVTYYWFKGGRCTPSDYSEVPQNDNFNTAVSLALGQLSDQENITVKPINDNVGVKPITIPNIDDPDYTPEAITIVTNVPWDDSYDDEDTDESTGLPVPYPTNSVPDVIDSIADKMVDDGFSIEDDPQPSDPDTPPPAPSEVFYPLLPVSAPSFNFNLSGIWHYVREWVSSLGAWFSLVFTMWSYLPYALIVPVYATAVIVIVLGVYKRFFM